MYLCVLLVCSVHELHHYQNKNIHIFLKINYEFLNAVKSTYFKYNQ